MDLGGRRSEKVLRVLSAKGKKLLSNVMPNLKNNDLLFYVIAKFVPSKKICDSRF